MPNNELNFQAFNATELTKIVAFDSYEDYAEYLTQHPDVAQYTLGLVSIGGNIPGEETENYSNVYYGQSKVTDIIVTTDTPTSGSEFPNNKIYVVPVTDGDIWALSGQDNPDPIGYQMYMKYDDVVTPIQGSGTIAYPPYIVTLTPTAADYSGTMDKTVAEIYEAYQLGRRLVFRMALGNNTFMECDCTARFFGGNTYPSFNGYSAIDSPVEGLVFAWTGTTSDGSRNTYGTTIYPLTPLS